MGFGHNSAVVDLCLITAIEVKCQWGVVLEDVTLLCTKEEVLLICKTNKQDSLCVYMCV